MKVLECFSIAGVTVIAVDGKMPRDMSKLIVDGVEYELVQAYDIGERIAFRGELNILGKEVQIV